MSSSLSLSFSKRALDRSSGLILRERVTPQRFKRGISSRRRIGSRILESRRSSRQRFLLASRAASRRGSSLEQVADSPKAPVPFLAFWLIVSKLACISSRGTSSRSKSSSKSKPAASLKSGLLCEEITAMGLSICRYPTSSIGA
jgi:hypothetical protein